MEYFEGGLIVPGTVRNLKYQADLVKPIASIDNQNNWFIALPTGLGKTYIALQLIDFFYAFGSVLLMAPTNPLLVQHFETFKKCIRFADEIDFVKGGRPDKREEIWKKRGIFIATPQTVQNDLRCGRLNFSDFSLAIFDEAHLTVGQHAYVRVAEFATAQKVRIVAMSASPGKKAKKAQLQHNLNIGKWAVKKESSKDVLPYVFPKEEIIRVDNPSRALLELISEIERHLLRKSEYFYQKGFSVNPDKIMRRKDLDALKLQINEKDFWRRKWYSAQLGLYYRWFYIYRVIVTEGYQVALRYMKRIEKQSENYSDRSPLKKMCQGLIFKKLKFKLTALIAEGELHPKEKALLELLDYIWRPKDSIVVFGNSQQTNQYLAEMINRSDLLIAGQAELIAGRKFMTAREQSKILKDFADKEFGILISTTVLELGMHLPVLNALVSYSVPQTDISYVQRWGRVGRVCAGKVYVIMVKHDFDRSMFFAAKSSAQAV